MQIKSLLLFSVGIILFTSCKKSNVNSDPTANDEIHDFIWSGMNTYYLWQEDVPDLADGRFATYQQLWSYYAGYESPSDVFNSLLYQPGTVDRFSWIVDDYVALENSFQGINVSSGMEFGLVRFSSVPSDIFGYVRYVVAGSDAESKGITRGMLFTEVDGTQITENNYRDLLFGSNLSYTITLADYNDGDPVSNGNSISLTKTQIQENPVHLVTTITEGSHKIGYLMYNQFASSFDGDLNAAFATLQSENITDLIVDLRYNGGGSVRTATYLGGMITGQFDGELFSREIWNLKVQEAIDESNFVNNFTNQINNGAINEAINSLNLSRVYFITTYSSASASELVMNSLSSYIDVKSVGATTRGKVHGSATLYDSDNFTRNGDNLNPNHSWAMQPLVLEIVNANGSNDPNGITPTVELDEDYSNLGTLGDRSDPLIDRTVILITTGSRSSAAKSTNFHEEVSNSQINKPSKNNMYLDLD